MTAFLLTWKETVWPHENIMKLINALESDGYVDEPWRIAAHKRVKAGDRVFLLRQGGGSKGVFGVGEIIGPPALRDTGDGNMQLMAPIRFTKLVDPEKRLLIGEEAVRNILNPVQLNARKSGYPLRDEQAAALAELTMPGETVKQGGSGDSSEKLSATPHAPASAIVLGSVFVQPPRPLGVVEVGTGRSTARSVQKFDPARDEANRALGEEGESFVLTIERERLKAAGRADLAAKVKWVSKDDGDGFGYDIVSFTDDDQKIYIEVKTTKGPLETHFFLSENERRSAAEKRSTFQLYRVFNFGSDPKICKLTGPLDDKLTLEPFSYRATVNGRKE